MYRNIRNVEMRWLHEMYQPLDVETGAYARQQYVHHFTPGASSGTSFNFTHHVTVCGLKLYSSLHNSLSHARHL